MRTINFLNKFAFICNLCFLLCFLIERSKFLNSLPNVQSIIIILGVISIVINSLMLLISLFVMKKTTLKRGVVFFNAMFFLVQFYHYFISEASKP